VRDVYASMDARRRTRAHISREIGELRSSRGDPDGVRRDFGRSGQALPSVQDGDLQGVGPSESRAGAAFPSPRRHAEPDAVHFRLCRT
jgi:hypothetical protein